jgi:type II secretory pathway pseudopilin PulG
MMKISSRKPLIAMITLAAAVAMPTAFAQSATTNQQANQQGAGQAAQQERIDAAQDTATATTDPTTTSESATGAAESATGAATESPQQTTGSAGQQGWEQVDTDRDGSISKQEASANAGLSQVFGQADADADGLLSTDEYKSFVDQNYGKPATP